MPSCLWFVVHALVPFCGTCSWPSRQLNSSQPRLENPEDENCEFFPLIYCQRNERLSVAPTLVGGDSTRNSEGTALVPIQTPPRRTSTKAPSRWAGGDRYEWIKSAHLPCLIGKCCCCFCFWSVYVSWFSCHACLNVAFLIL